MMPGNWQAGRRIGMGLLLLAVLGTNSQAQSDAGKTDPPRTSATMGQLRLLWDKWDLDKDGFLDKRELAIAFRGPGKKAYDWRETAKKPKEESSEPKSDSLKDLPPKDEKPAKTPDYSKYPDYNFLVMLDTDKDEKISRDEFVTWAREYATQLRDAADLNKKTTDLKAKVAKAPPKNKKALEAQVKKQQAEIARLKKKLSKVKVPGK